MSATKRNTNHQILEFDDIRSSWQIERGERFGNNRKSVSKEKKRESKLVRTRISRKFIKEFYYV